MGGSEYEDIRDDQFYTSLLLGCRRGAGASTCAPSRPIAARDVKPVVPPAAPAAFASPSVVVSHAPRPGNRHIDRSPGSGTATSAGESSPPASPMVPKCESAGDAESHQLKRIKRELSSDVKLPRAPSAEDEGVAVVSGPSWTNHRAMYKMSGTLQRSGPASAVSSVNSSPKSETQEAPPRTVKRRFRKATHTIRKEEKEHLLEEIAQLEAHISGLKKRAINAATSPEENEQDKILATRVLRDAVQTQQREFAKIQAMMSEYTLCNIRAGSPIQTSIRLKKGKEERRHALVELKRKKLLDAKQFLARRRPSLDPCKPMCEDHRYELPNGDFCSTRFTTIQFEGVDSVRRVFDLLVEYFCNIEICISEKLGHITIREDDDGGGVGITENCLVSMTNSGLPMESNTVLFSEFYDPDDGFGHDQGHGLIVAEFIEEDERHPYNPRERIRRDVSAILELTAYTRAVEAFGKNFPVDPSSQPQEVVVVMTRWVYSKLWYPSFPIARSAWEELRDNMDRWGETMHRTLVESLRANSGEIL